MQRSKLFHVLFWTSSFVVAIALGEVVARIGEAMLGTAAPGQVIEPAPLYVFDSIYGWSKQPNARVTVTAQEYRTTVSTDSLGMRGRQYAREKPEGTSRVLLVGDSFIEGYSVSDEEVVSARLEQELGERAGRPIEVLNGGTAGYSTDQELLFVMREARALRPDVIVLFFYRNDVYYNVMRRYWRGEKPYFEQTGSDLTLRGVPITMPTAENRETVDRGGPPVIRTLRAVNSWLGPHLALFRLIREAVESSPLVISMAIRTGASDVPGEYWPLEVDPHPEAARAWDMTEALIERMRDEAALLGSEFAVFYVPPIEAVDAAAWRRMRRTYAMSEGEWNATADGERLGRICERNGIRCIIPTEAFRRESVRVQNAGDALYFPIDGHWTAAGHRLAAQILTDTLLTDLQRAHPRQ